ncbi:MAG: dTDP-4-dehydrorhamnose 3,5-epimerase [Deltaproteobacteria bacterium]|nr:dTDP-4-dehydrorhamnose 3,5-epimerase [Deltaproteobacteria bacterium]
MEENQVKIRVESTDIEGVFFVHPELFRDSRGFFLESFREDVWAAEKLPTRFVQLNHSGSVKNVVRGLHFQWDPPMGKLMRVTAGSAFLVAVDIRKDSPTLGKWVGRELHYQEPVLFWAPAGCARGFAVTSDFAEVQYLCTGTYNGNTESNVLWNDPRIGIEWPVSDPIVSERDQRAKTLDEWLSDPLSDVFRTERI